MRPRDRLRADSRHYDTRSRLSQGRDSTNCAVYIACWNQASRSASPTIVPAGRSVRHRLSPILAKAPPTITNRRQVRRYQASPMYTVLPETVHVGSSIPTKLSPLRGPPGLFACLILDVRDGAMTPGTGRAFRGLGKGPATQPVQASSRASVARLDTAKAFSYGGLRRPTCGLLNRRSQVRVLSGVFSKSGRPANYGWPVRFFRGLRGCCLLPVHSTGVTTD